MKKLVCHCGAVEAEINLDGDLAEVIKCNCSICKRKGAIMSMVKNEDFKIVKGEDKLRLYQFHTKVAKRRAPPKEPPTPIVSFVLILLFLFLALLSSIDKSFP